MTSAPGSYPVGSGKRTSNPHHLIVEQKALQISKEFASLIREAVSSSKSSEILRTSHKQFAQVKTISLFIIGLNYKFQCDKLFISTEARITKIGKNLKVIEKSDQRIISSLDTIPTIQANLAAAKSHFKPPSVTSQSQSSLDG